MRLARLWIPLVLALCLANPPSWGSPPATNGSSPTLVVSGLGHGSVPLDGAWEFHLGDDMAWASPGFDDSTWERIGVDKPWGMQTHFGYAGYAWYRRKIHIDASPEMRANLALLLPPVSDTDEVYWNGVEIAHLGKMPPYPSWDAGDARRIVPLQTPPDAVLAIRVWKAPFFSGDAGVAGGLWTVPLLGDPQAIADHKAAIDLRTIHARAESYIADLLIVPVILASLIGWLFDRNRKVLFWTAVWALAGMGMAIMGDFSIPWPQWFAVAMEQPLFSLTDVAVWFLLLNLLELNHNPRLFRFVRACAFVTIGLQCLDAITLVAAWKGVGLTLFWQFADFGLTVPVTLLQALPLVLIGFALRRRLSAPRWIVAGLGAAYQVTLGLRNAAGQGQRFTHWTLAAKLQPVQNVEYFLLMGGIVYGAWRFTAEQRSRKAALEQEYKSAQELQRVLIPETLPPVAGFSLTSAYVPAQQVGGDFFQVIADAADGSALVIVGDVSGKGLKAAMTVSLIIGTLRTLAEQTNDPAEILAGLNRRLHGRLQHGFATCLALRVDQDGLCVAASAGHLPPFVNEREIEFPPALPLGLTPDASYASVAMPLAIGDRLTLYTDGLLEARDADGELFGFDRLRALIATAPDAQAASAAAVAFGQDDDITVLTLTRLAIGVESTSKLSAPALVPTGAAAS